jgi:hypothetical protein
MMPVLPSGSNIGLMEPLHEGQKIWVEQVAIMRVVPRDDAE